eukprot:TRINITY_DN16870_c0_g1_i2.p1 TRINITY_DN16870_c0_g1~~TRINITY_DN16870_c0_g1_i2.p1  ORF type:complete len:423 (+),score=35.03 TRINITY_DN16870_c0_g1_i2:57-1271(+)
MLFYSTLGVVLLLLEELTLLAGSSRVHVARAAVAQPSPELFGVIDMLPDRLPTNEQGVEEMYTEAWAEIRAAILNRLSEVKSGLVENFCWVSHEEILDNEGHIAEGGLVVVVQKLAAFRINFYRMEEFRSWVRVKPLDIGSNKKFADERDVWVVRLTDGSQASKAALPSLGGPSSQGTRPRSDVDTLEHRVRVGHIRNVGFARSVLIPRVGQELLIRDLAPLADESFTFELYREPSMFSTTWRWDFREANIGSRDIILNANRTVLSARRHMWPRRRRWTMSDASSTDLFHVESSPDGKEHRLMTLWGHESLFVIHVEPISMDNVTEGEEVGTTKIFKGDGETLLYTGVTDDTFGFMFFYRGNETGNLDRMVGAKFPGVDDRLTLYVANGADAALLLTTAAVTTA